MAEVTAATVQSLRQRTGLPMMDCKRALQETGGDADKAVELLRKAGAKTMEKRAGRSTLFGRIGVYTDFAAGVATMVDLRCESAPVAGSPEFVGLANDMARQLATGPGAAAPEALLSQPSPSKPSQTLQQQFEDLNNRIREAFKVERIVRIDAPCGGYVHHSGTVGVLLRVEGGNPDLARDICMHIAAMRPSVVAKEELDPAQLEKEREILSEAARSEGKPEKIIAKMVEGRLKDFYLERCLLEQPHANREKYNNQTIGQLAKEAGMKILGFVHWEIKE